MARKRSHSDTDIGLLAATAGKRRKIHNSPARGLNQRASILDTSQRSQDIQQTACMRCADDHVWKQRNKKQRIQPPVSSAASIDSWIEHLADPPDFENFETMSIPSRLKRTRSASDASDTSFHSDAESESGASRKSKGSIYKDPRYPTMMVSKGSFMHDSPDGLPPEEVQLCTRLLTETVPLPADPLFEPQYLPRFRAMLQDKSELRICMDLHPHLIPSAEVLGLLHAGKFEGLVEGHNDRWLDARVFCIQLPQPDRTLAHRPSAFTDQERRKIETTPGGMANFTARAGMMFPFATCEIKCGKEALLIADHANLNSMAVASHMIVDLHRLAGNIMAVHRKCLGFSISHDDGTIRIYVHFAKIDGDRVTLYRKPLRDYAYTDKECEDSRTSWRFFWNICDIFAPIHLQLIKEAIKCLPDPLPRPFDSQTASDLASSVEQNLDALTPATSTSDAAFSKPNVRQRVTNTALMQRLDQQQKEFVVQLEQQQKEAKERENKLITQLEKQQEEAREQQREAREQQREAREQQREAREQQREAKEREEKLIARLDAQHSELLNISKQKSST